MPHTHAENILKTVWDNQGFPVDPVWIAKQMGIDVIVVELRKDISGVLLKEVGHDPVIALNHIDSTPRKRFTCAHELGHYVKHTDDGNLEYGVVEYRNGKSKKGTDPDEVFANQFAACLLMPEENVRQLKEKNYSTVEMSVYFGVSDDAMNYRLKNLGL